MRVTIQAQTELPVFIPFNYSYQLSSVIYRLIEKSSPEYSEFLHDNGFFRENRKFKLFTFSKLNFSPHIITEKGFKGVRQISFQFSTRMEKSFEHLILGIFSDKNFEFGRREDPAIFEITHVETLKEPVFQEQMNFYCLSPIAVSVRNNEIHSSKHYLDYLNPSERTNYIAALFENMKMKYKTIYREDFAGNQKFDFSFDPAYIVKKSGKIRKMIRFGKSNIVGMEAPFTISAAPELIKIGYDCGFGVNNSAGFGMAEFIELQHD